METLEMKRKNNPENNGWFLLTNGCKIQTGSNHSRQPKEREDCFTIQKSRERQFVELDLIIRLENWF